MGRNGDEKRLNHCGFSVPNAFEWPLLKSLNKSAIWVVVMVDFGMLKSSGPASRRRQCNFSSN